MNRPAVVGTHGAVPHGALRWMGYVSGIMCAVPIGMILLVLILPDSIALPRMVIDGALLAVSLGAVVVLAGVARVHRGRARWSWLLFALAASSGFVGMVVPPALLPGVGVCTAALLLIGLGLFLPLSAAPEYRMVRLLVESVSMGVSISAVTAALVQPHWFMPEHRLIAVSLSLHGAMVYGLVRCSLRCARGGGRTVAFMMLAMLCGMLAVVCHLYRATQPLGSAGTLFLVAPLFAQQRIVLALAGVCSVTHPPRVRGTPNLARAAWLVGASLPVLTTLIALGLLWQSMRAVPWLIWTLLILAAGLFMVMGGEMWLLLHARDHAFGEQQQARSHLQRTQELRLNEVSALCHDSRNQLHQVRTLVDQVMRSIEQGEMVDMLDIRMRVRRAFDLQVETLGVLLDTNLLYLDRLRPHIETVDLRDVVPPLLREFDARMHEKGARCQFQEPHAPVWVRVDRARLGRVLRNMLDNALRHVDPGEGLIDIQIACQAATVVCTMRDNGVGLTPEHMHMLETCFSNATQGMLPEPGESRLSAGLGLVLSARLLTLLGGHLTLSSPISDARGTEVRILLPVALQPTSSLRGDGQQDAPLRGRHVLVVEDDAACAAQIAMTARALGASTVEIDASAEQALGRVEAGAQFDLVIIDQYLAGSMRGVAFAMHLAQHPTGRAARRISCSSADRSIMESDGMPSLALFHAYLAKPLDSGILIQTLLRQVSALPALRDTPTGASVPPT